LEQGPSSTCISSAGVSWRAGFYKKHYHSLKKDNFVRFFFTLFLAAFLFPVVAYADQLQDALAAYRRHDWPTALKLLQPLAEQGNLDAQYKLGYMYRDGTGVKKDEATALKWLRKAAEQENAAFDKEISARIVELKVKAEAGDVEAQEELAEKYFLRSSTRASRKDEREGMKWRRKAGKAGHAEAQYRLGLDYQWGDLGVNKDDAEALKWFRMAAEQGVDAAQHTVGSYYEYGKVVKRNYTEAAKWYRKAADQGDEIAQMKLSILYQHGKGVPQDWAEAYFWWAIAWKGGVLPTYAGKGPDPRGDPKAHLSLKQMEAVEKRIAEWKPVHVLPSMVERP
jgi:uncharacterized protein